MSDLWQRYRGCLSVHPTIGLSVDISRMRFADEFFPSMNAAITRAFDEMAALEQGAIANSDEGRQVGHYWLRAPQLAPSAKLRDDIEGMQARVRAFAAGVHSGRIQGPCGEFSRVIVIGIGGSALGPQFVSSALGGSASRMKMFFIDNTDPDGIDRVLGEIDDRLEETLTVVISKSGGTKETRNGMLEAKHAYEARGLTFGNHAVAVTGEGSELDRVAVKENWLDRFPMWDWVGGRTSELSAVGLLPAALEGISIDALVEGACDTDEITRGRDARQNPAALLALMWHYAGRGRGEKAMVILPYKDRLMMFSRYLQQLVMESVGKERDLDGHVVHQGLTVYGNKGSTDQHAYVQQLRDGLANFFVTFLSVLEDRTGKSIEVDPGVTSGDYLFGFLEGTRRALYENGRESITLTLERVDARAIGVLIALYERAVGFYASLIRVNAYHQPGVEAGKKAATDVLALQAKVIAALGQAKGTALTAENIADRIGAREQTETIWRICEHASANVDHAVVRTVGATPFDATYERR